MNNQRGQITVDFIFAIVLVLGFTALLFVMSFTLMVASTTQYITYSAAHVYSEAHLDQATQVQRGQDKYHALIANPVMKPLYSGGWFKVDADASIGDGTKIVPGLEAAIGTSNEFWGVGTHFNAPILDFHIPFFGSTVPDGDGKGAGFATYLASYVGREPSADECIQLTAQRWTAILNMSSSYSGANNAQYFPMTDNGC